MKRTPKWNLTEFHTPKGFLPEVNSYTNTFIYRNETLICGIIKYRAFFTMQDYWMYLYPIHYMNMHISQ